MNVELFWFLLVGGLPVVTSYSYIYNKVLQSDVSSFKLWAGLKGNMLIIWLFSMVLTVISYGYLLYFFVWNATLDEWEQILLLVSYVLFFNYAGQYGAVAMLDSNNNEKSGYLFWTLFMVAFACVGFLVVACVESEGDTEGVLAIVSASIMLFHHAYFDAYYWYWSFLNDDYSPIWSLSS